jgi:virginiamycin B lyase
MKMMLVMLAALAASVSALPSVAEAATGELPASLARSTFVGNMVAGPDGNVWFSAQDYGESEGVVGKVTPGGEVAEYAVPEGAASIATGADGNLWFTEAHGIGRITPGGDATSFELAEGSGAPRALTLGADGNVWFVTAKPAAAGRISPSGSVTMFPLATAGEPSAIASGPGGDLWFTVPEAGRVGRITFAGEVDEFPLPGGARPNSIVPGPDGNLWFSDASQPRVGRITPAGRITLFPVPTIDPTTEVAAGPGGRIWFAADDEIGAISTGGKVTWPSCFSPNCEYPPAAIVTGPDGRLWVASGVGSCPGYCGGSSEQSYLFSGGSSIGPFAEPSLTLGIGPRLAPVRHGRTSIVVGCGEDGACRGTLRLRVLVKPPGDRFFARRISTVRYLLAAGEIRKVTLRLPRLRWDRIRYARGFVIVDANQAGSQVAKRGFYFSPKQGGMPKQF